MVTRAELTLKPLPYPEVSSCRHAELACPHTSLRCQLSLLSCLSLIASLQVEVLYLCNACLVLDS